MAETRTEKDSTASKVASEPDAINEPELTFSPFVFTYFPKTSFTTMATAMITREVRL